MVVQNNTWKFNDIKLNVDLSPDDKVHIIQIEVLWYKSSKSK